MKLKLPNLAGILGTVEQAPPDTIPGRLVTKGIAPKVPAMLIPTVLGLVLPLVWKRIPPGIAAIVGMVASAIAGVAAGPGKITVKPAG